MSGSSDRPDISLSAVVLHAEPAVLKEAPQGLLLPNDVSEGRVDQASFEDHGMLGLGPDEELVDQGPHGDITQCLAFRRRELPEQAVRAEDSVDEFEPVDADFMLADGRFPELAASVTPISSSR
jgi:hypothetical protein